MADEGLNLVGYARVSTADQNPDMQVNALISHGVPENQLFVEHASALSKNRPQFELALKTLRRGDVLVIWKLDRLFRDLYSLLKLSNEFQERGIEFRSLTEQLDSTTPQGRFFFNIMGTLAQFERDLIAERTREGVALAIAEGRMTGRPAALSPEKWGQAGKLLTDGLSDQKVADAVGVSRGTIVNYRDDLKAGAPYPFKVWLENGKTVELKDGD